MEITDIAKLQKLRTDTLRKEQQLEESFRLFEKKQQIDFDRPSDYGQRVFNMIMYFDEINIMALNTEHIDKIKFLLVEYRQLRKEQRNLEVEVAKQKIGPKKLYD